MPATNRFVEMNLLGETIEKIATEKAGIIKPGVPAVTSAAPGHGLETIGTIARERRRPLGERPAWEVCR